MAIWQKPNHGVIYDSSAFGAPLYVAPDKGFIYHEEFLTDIAFGDYNNKTGSSGSTLSAAEEPADGEKVLGLVSGDAGANTEYAIIWLDTYRSSVDEGVFWLSQRVKFDTLGSGADSIKYFFGLGNAGTSAADDTIGVGFRYDHAANGAFWELFTGNSGEGTTTYVADGGGGRASAPIVADTYQVIGMRIDILNNSIKFYQDNTFISEITTTLPTDNVTNNAAIMLLKIYSDSASTATTRKAVVDFVDFRCVWS